MMSAYWTIAGSIDTMVSCDLSPSWNNYTWANHISNNEQEFCWPICFSVSFPPLWLVSFASVLLCLQSISFLPFLVMLRYGGVLVAPRVLQIFYRRRSTLHPSGGSPAYQPYFSNKKLSPNLTINQINRMEINNK